MNSGVKKFNSEIKKILMRLRLSITVRIPYMLDLSVIISKLHITAVFEEPLIYTQYSTYITKDKLQSHFRGAH
jgi:hypothetical protein